METHRKVLVILGNQLVPLDRLKRQKNSLIYMTEDFGACTYVRHHKHKLVLILSAMRAYADKLREAGHTVHYERLEDNPRHLTFSDKLAAVVQKYQCRRLLHFEMQDKSMDRRMRKFAQRHSLQRAALLSPMFLTPREEFANWRAEQMSPRMAEFYKWQRRRMNILMTDSGKPLGGRWSFDTDNRKRLPPGVALPDLPVYDSNPYVAGVKQLVNRCFADHPGDVSNFMLPTTRDEAHQWLRDFLEQRFTNFGHYEDALTTRSDHVFHLSLIHI